MLGLILCVKPYEDRDDHRLSVFLQVVLVLLTVVGLLCLYGILQEAHEGAVFAHPPQQPRNAVYALPAVPFSATTPPNKKRAARLPAPPQFSGYLQIDQKLPAARL